MANFVKYYIGVEREDAVWGELYSAVYAELFEFLRTSSEGTAVYRFVALILIGR
jgi:hypothetical protein